MSARWSQARKPITTGSLLRNSPGSGSAAAADDGDHFRLALIVPHGAVATTWFGTSFCWGFFREEVRAKEVRFYRQQLLPYGLPLDNRAQFTKTDWQVWTATLADSRQDFDLLMKMVYRFVNETPDRVPLTDWYLAQDGRLRRFSCPPSHWRGIYSVSGRPGNLGKVAGRALASGWGPLTASRDSGAVSRGYCTDVR